LIIEGLGQGMILGALMVAAQASASSSDAAHATSMFNFSRSFGMCLGVAVGSTVFQNMLSHYLDSVGLPRSIAHDAEAYLVQLQELPDESPYRHAVLEQYSKAFQIVFAVVTGVAALGSVGSLFIGKRSM
jgi:hypothetical protein